MDQKQFTFKNGVLKLIALAVIALMLVVGLAVSASADPVPIVVDVADLVFSDAAISVENNTITKTYDASNDLAIPGTITVQGNAGLDNTKVVVGVTSATWGRSDAGNTQVTVVFNLTGPEAAQYTISNAVYSGKILQKGLAWSAGSATASKPYAIGATTYTVEAGDVSGLPAISTAGLSAELTAKVNAMNAPAVATVAAFSASAAGNYDTTATVTLSDNNFTIPAVPVTVTIQTIEIDRIEWTVGNLTYGDDRDVTVTGYSGTTAYDIYSVDFPVGYADAGNYTLTAVLNNPNFTEKAGLIKTKQVTIEPAEYGVTMKDQSVLGDGKTPYTIGVESENMPDSVRGLITYTVNGTAFLGTEKAGTYTIMATLPGGNYRFKSNGQTVTTLSATLTIAVDQIPVAVKDSEGNAASTVILTAKKGLAANVGATANVASDVKLPKGTKYAQSFQIRLENTTEGETYSLIIPLSYEVYRKGCKDLSASSLYLYDKDGNPVTALSQGYKVSAAAGYFKIDGLKGDLGTFTFTIAPQWSNGGLPLIWIIILLIVLIIVLLVVMFFIGRAVRKNLHEGSEEVTVADEEPEETEAADEEETPTEEAPDLAAAAEETAEELAETPAEEEAAEEATEEEVAAAAEEAKDELEAEAVEEAPAEEEPSVEAFAAVAVAEEAEEAPEEEDGIPAYLRTKSGGLLYIDTKKKPDLYQEMLALEAAGKGQVVYRYRKSYQSKLAQADGKVGDYYSAIKNALLHYRGVKARKSWNYEAFNRGRIPIAKIIPRGKTLYLYLGIDPAELEGTKYGAVDVSAKKKFAPTPSLMKIRGDRKFKFALELIAKICGETLALKPTNKPDQEYRFDHMTNDELLEAGMVKQMAAIAPLDGPAETYGQQPAEAPVAEAPAEEAAPEEAAVPASAEVAEEAPAEEAPAEEAPAEEAPAEEAPAEEAPAEEAPAEEAPAEEAPADEAPEEVSEETEKKPEE